jgi:hypothetical protein
MIPVTPCGSGEGRSPKVRGWIGLSPTASTFAAAIRPLSLGFLHFQGATVGDNHGRVGRLREHTRYAVTAAKRGAGLTRAAWGLRYPTRSMARMPLRGRWQPLYFPILGGSGGSLGGLWKSG